MTFCPDCEREIPAAAFITHREEMHPPTETKTITITDSLETRPGDPRRGERMGWEE